MEESEIIDIYFSPKNDQFVLATKQDVRVLDCVTGKQTKILVHLSKQDEDIT